MPKWKPRNTKRARELRNQATPAERRLWRYLSRSQTGAKFSRQMQVGPFFADFLCRELKLVVEIDGFSHDLRPGYDAARDRWLRGKGYHVLRFTNAEVLGDAEAVAVAIGQKVARLAGRQATAPVSDRRSSRNWKKPYPTSGTGLGRTCRLG
jgi:BirA family biotin operon repressor/biotin-[acetyl-CoA-carboxylase] ligase